MSKPPPPVGTDGGWSYFSDPRAVEVTTPRRLLWSGWVSSLGSIVAGSYDPATQHVQTMVLHDRLQNDDHANPSVLALPDGRVTYFWSAHNGLFMYYRTTTTPGDVHSFGPLRTLPVGCRQRSHGSEQKSRNFQCLRSQPACYISMAATLGGSQ